jgi:hypothetical protein
MWTPARREGRDWRRVVQPRDRQPQDPEHGSGLIPVLSRSGPRFERQGAADASERKAREV